MPKKTLGRKKGGTPETDFLSRKIAPKSLSEGTRLYKLALNRSRV